MKTFEYSGYFRIHVNAENQEDADKKLSEKMGNIEHEVTDSDSW